MGRIIVDHDAHTGITEQFHKDPVTGEIRIKKTQDLEALNKVNKFQRDNEESGWKGEFHKVATIPLIVIDMWREELKAMGVSNPDPLAKCNKSFFVAKLNNRDWLNLRTKTGNV